MRAQTSVLLLTCLGRWSTDSCESDYVKLQGCGQHVKIVGPGVAPVGFLTETQNCCFEIEKKKYIHLDSQNAALTFSWVHDCVVKQCGHTPSCS